jgi:hypothetical protein
MTASNINLLRIWPPYLLVVGSSTTSVPFEADRIDDGELDISLSLAPTGAVLVTQRPGMGSICGWWGKFR